MQIYFEKPNNNYMVTHFYLKEHILVGDNLKSLHYFIFLIFFPDIY